MRWKRIAGASGLVLGIGSSVFIAQRQYDRLSRTTWKDIEPPNFELKSREENIQLMKQGMQYDVLVVGGGATGTGVALDAATRKLKVALVEKDDFAAGRRI